MNYQKVLTYKNLDNSYKKARYACKGIITEKAYNYQRDLDEGKELQFDKITKLYDANPQNYGQPPLTFLREVLACIVDTGLMEKNIYHQDVINRAKKYLEAFPSVGVYPDTQGYLDIRENIANYISKRDGGIPCDKHNIFNTCGSVGAAKFIMKLLVKDKGIDGVMLPIPSHSMFSAAINLEGGKVVGYYLDESKNWDISLSELEHQYEKATKGGINVKGLVVINPNNPTGQILSEASMKDILSFCAKHTLVLFADEVYQQNVYNFGQKFYSFKKVLMEMGAPIDSTVELISSNSISKGLVGEGGFRGGYMEMINIEEGIVDQLQKLDSMVETANTIGQVALDLMVFPPSLESNCSQETINQYTKEKHQIYDSLKERAQKVAHYLNKCNNITTNDIYGSVYAFPRVTFHKNAIEAAKENGLLVDSFYCHQCLDETGIVILPGSAFGQVEGSYHFRISILEYDPIEMEETMKKFMQFNDDFHAKFA